MSNTKVRYREAVNPFLQWADDRLLDTGIHEVKVTDLYADYRSWCSSNGNLPFAVRTFESELERHYKRNVKRRGTDGPRPRVIEGLRLR